MLPEVGGALRLPGGDPVPGPLLGEATGTNVTGIQHSVID